MAITKQTGRKSTTVTAERSIRSNNPWARSVKALEAKEASTRATHSGPVGLGRGKNGLKRLQAVHRAQLKKRNQKALSCLKKSNAQISTKPAIPRAAMARLIGSIKNDMGLSPFKMQVAAIDLIHEVAEHYLVGLMEDSYLITKAAKRTTLMPKDIELYLRLNRARR